MLGDVIEKWGGAAEAPMDLYTDVFHLGEHFIQVENEPPGRFKGNPLVIGFDGERNHRKILFEDTFAETLAEFQAMEWAFVSGCTYLGRTNSAERQRQLFALVFDLDGAGGGPLPDPCLNNFFSGCTVDAYPLPQHVVVSGHGVHLYYVLEEPVDLWPNVKTQLKELKYALTRAIWNGNTSNEPNPQYQGINQAFRVPGSKAKPDAGGVEVRAWRVNRHPTTVEELNGYVPEASRADLSERYAPTSCTIEEARRRWPDWYDRVVAGGARGQWRCKRDLYDWWLRRIGEEARYGHRYFCVMCLAIFAAKCGIYDREAVKADAMALVPYLTSLNPEQPFTEADVDSALECLDGRYATFPRSDMARLSSLEMPANKRNGRSQKTHMAVMRAIQNTIDPDASWRNLSGAPTKAELVRSYAAAHPGESHSAIARALGVSRPTVIKWLKSGRERDRE